MEEFDVKRTVKEWMIDFIGNEDNILTLMDGTEEEHSELMFNLNMGTTSTVERTEDDGELDVLKAESEEAIKAFDTLINRLDDVKAELQDMIEEAESYKSYNQEDDEE